MSPSRGSAAARAAISEAERRSESQAPRVQDLAAGQQHAVRAADNFGEQPPVSRRGGGDGDAAGLKHGIFVSDRKADGKVMKFDTPFFDARRNQNQGRLGHQRRM